MRSSVLVYSLLSAALYCGLMPPWEGFDELYHYGYVQYVSRTWSLPVAGETSLSRELWNSLDFVPISNFIQPYVYRPSTNFPEYFQLSDEERRQRRERLDLIDPALQSEPSPRDNYEAKQAPLTYLLLAPFDRILSSTPLPRRLFAIRLLLSTLAIALLWVGTRRLARRLGLGGAMEAAALLVIFSGQMLFAVACHVSSDALTLPWLLFFIAAVIDSCESPTVGRTAVTAILMAAGLLIKASVLVLMPLVFAGPLVLLARRAMSLRRAVQPIALTSAILIAAAGPWYLRNVLLYRNLTATNDTTAALSPKDLVHAALALPWRESIATTAHSALWTGNNSFTVFSATTLNIVLALLGIAAALYVFRSRRETPEIVTVASIALYCAGLVFIATAFFHATRGGMISPMAWYMEVLAAPVLMLCFLGLARSGRSGRWVAIATVLLWAYVAGATWIAKLVPLYGGFEQARARPRELLAWYLHGSAHRNSILSNLCPATLPLLYILFPAVIVALSTVSFRIIAALHCASEDSAP